jgi:tRNA (guanine37-N1)-methyltransferase
MTWRASVLTVLPEMFPGPLDVSLIGKARGNGMWSLDVRDIREHGLGKHRTVDDTPSGGGPGMVMRADVAAAAIDAVRSAGDDRPLIYPSPRGARFTQSRAAELASGPGAIFFCCRFEGLDERVIGARRMEEISLGDFVLAGGEVATMAMIEACVRLLPGAIGDEKSKDDESFAAGLLEYPHYTRPQSFEGAGIPAVLTSGNHAEIARWRRETAENLTRARRPDLWAAYEKPLYEKRGQSANSPPPKAAEKAKNGPEMPARVPEGEDK